MTVELRQSHRAYLEAFERWYKSPTGEMVDGAADLKEACFDAMLEDARVALASEQERERRRLVEEGKLGKPCATCGKRMPVITKRGPGRPRKHCVGCKPPRRRT